MRVAELVNFQHRAHKVVDVSLGIECGVDKEFLALAGGPDAVSRKVETLKFIIDHEVKRAINTVYDQAVGVEISLATAKAKMTPMQKRKLEEPAPAG